jgi:hypothetical protein
VDHNRTKSTLGLGGGGVFTTGGSSLTLNDSSIRVNHVIGSGAGASGGGIYADFGSVLILDNTIVETNIADQELKIFEELPPQSFGGGIFSSGIVNILQSTIRDNIVSGGLANGGGIVAREGRIELTRISGNTAKGLRASTGGIEAGALIIESSVIDNNTSDFNGGVSGGRGIFNSTISNNKAKSCGGLKADTEVEIVNSTISGNTATQDGGGVCVYFNGANIRSSSIVGNTSNSDGFAGGTGGGIFVSSEGNAAEVSMSNSVLAGNLENGIGDHDDCDGRIQSGGFNLIQNGSGCTLLSGGVSDIFNVNAELGLLNYNGGPVVGALGSAILLLTHLPASNSSLINRGNPSGCTDNLGVLLNFDQRRSSRTVNGRCDIGAVEVQR